MKFKGLCIALLFIFLIGFSSTASGSQMQPNVSGDLKIISSNTNLKIGDTGYITIQGKPGTRYDIRTTYQIGDKSYNVTQMRVTDASGQATFSWVVGSGTTPGMNPATITGGGTSITITHSVTP